MNTDNEAMISIKFQILNSICMSNAEIKDSNTLLEMTKVMYEFVTDGVEMGDQVQSATVTPMVVN